MMHGFINDDAWFKARDKVRGTQEPLVVNEIDEAIVTHPTKEWYIPASQASEILEKYKDQMPFTGIGRRYVARRHCELMDAQRRMAINASNTRRERRYVPHGARDWRHSQKRRML